MTTETTIDEKKLTRVKALGHGSHKPPKNGNGVDACLMEAVAWAVGEPWSDMPACASPVIARFGRRVNDGLPDDETRTRLLLPLVPRIVGTAGNPKADRARAWMLADWAIRYFCPLAFDEAAKRHPSLAGWPAKLRALDPVIDVATATLLAAMADRIFIQHCEENRDREERVRERIRNYNDK